jgi:acyl-CoA synthetase (AMP-forming)/AMP-acid ligase II
MTAENLSDAFAVSAGIHASKTAVFWAEHELGYDLLHRQAAWMAHRLTAVEGIRAGDRVGI